MRENLPERLMAEVCKANQSCLLELEWVARYSWHLVYWTTGRTQSFLASWFLLTIKDMHTH